MFRTIRWRIAIPYVVLILLVMLGLALYLSRLVREVHLASLENQLTDEARLVGDALGSQLARGEPGEAVDSLVLRFADLLGARVTIIGADGTVVGESHEDRTQMDNHLYRPEVQEALATGQGSSIRFSRTVQYDMMYVAVPVKSGQQVTGFVRLALPLPPRRWGPWRPGNDEFQRPPFRRPPGRSPCRPASPLRRFAR